MKKTISLNRKDLNEAIENIVSTILKENFSEGINEELHNVVHKEGDNWKIKGHKGKGDNEADGDWKADYKSKESAEAALRGYFTQKESKDEKGNKIDEASDFSQFARVDNDMRNKFNEFLGRIAYMAHMLDNQELYTTTRDKLYGVYNEFRHNVEKLVIAKQNQQPINPNEQPESLD